MLCTGSNIILGYQETEEDIQAIGLMDVLFSRKYLSGSCFLQGKRLYEIKTRESTAEDVTPPQTNQETTVWCWQMDSVLLAQRPRFPDAANVRGDMS